MSFEMKCDVKGCEARVPVPDGNLLAAGVLGNGLPPGWRVLTTFAAPPDEEMPSVAEEVEAMRALMKNPTDAPPAPPMTRQIPSVIRALSMRGKRLLHAMPQAITTHICPKHPLPEMA